MENLPCRITAALIGAVLLVFVTACDSREVTTPDPIMAPGPVRLNTGAMSLGGGLLSPPATSHPNDVASAPFQAFAPAPAGTWIIVRTSGEVQSKFNEACGRAATPFWPCGTGNQVSPFSPTFPSTVGPVQVVLQRGTSETPVPLRGSGGGGVGLLYSVNGGALAGRVNVAANFWWEPSYDYIPAFFFSGGYQVTAEAVPPPLEVRHGGAGPDGTTEYSVVPLYGLQLVNPAEPYYFQFWPAGAVTWTFIRGANVGNDPRSPGGEEIPVSECGFQPVCSFRPPGPGRMQASAWIEGREVTVRASITQQRLELDCNGERGVNIAIKVIRGRMLDCNVRGTPAGALRVLGWTFAGGGHVVPAPDAEPYTDTRWAGEMVVSGTVTVPRRPAWYSCASSQFVAP